MNNLLIFFAIPFAVVVISIALQKLLRCPFLVAGIIFSTFLVIGFAISNLNIVIAGIIYAILAFITAYLTMLISRMRCQNQNNNINNTNNVNNINNTSNNINTCNCRFNRR